MIAFAPVSRAPGSGTALAVPMGVAAIVKRMFLMLAVMLMFITGLGFVKFQQIQTAIAKGAAFQPPPTAVTTIVAAQEQWPATLSAIGTMAAVQGVTVSADLPGIVDRITFESGRAVREGEVLAERRPDCFALDGRLNFTDLRRATEAARADLLASDHFRKAVVTTLVSDVAGAYFSLLELDMELAIARRTLQLREDSLTIIRNPNAGDSERSSRSARASS
jgi:multidrug efflux pump subunit AcrA (membrane-fusion protein)